MAKRQGSRIRTSSEINAPVFSYQNLVFVRFLVNKLCISMISLHQVLFKLESMLLLQSITNLSNTNSKLLPDFVFVNLKQLALFEELRRVANSNNLKEGRGDPKTKHQWGTTGADQDSQKAKEVRICKATILRVYRLQKS